MPNSVYFALAALMVVSFILKNTVIGRRFEAIGANPAAARAVGLNVRFHQTMAYVYSQLLCCMAGVLLAGITREPTAFQGDSLLLPSVAVVVLGSTSLLGGRGFPVSTVIAAFFLNQLSQFALAIGVPYSAQTIIQALALGFGIGVYSVQWTRNAKRPVNEIMLEETMKASFKYSLSIAALALAVFRVRSAIADAPSWCGSKKATIALLDGFGGNSWRQVTTAAGKQEAEKCPSITKYEYADGQGNTQKAISDIKGFAAKGVDALVVFGDAGPAVLPALTKRVQGRQGRRALSRRCRRQGRGDVYEVRRRLLRGRWRELG